VEEVEKIFAAVVANSRGEIAVVGLVSKYALLEVEVKTLKEFENWVFCRLGSE